MNWLTDILNHYGKGSTMSKFIAWVAVIFAVLFIIMATLILLNFGRVKKLWGLEFETIPPVHDTVRIYMPDTSSKTSHPKKQITYSPSKRKGKDPKDQSEEKKESKNNFEGENNGNLIIGDNGTINNNLDLPEPVFKDTTLKRNVKEGDKYVSHYIISIDSKRIIYQMRIEVRGHHIIYFDAGNYFGGHHMKGQSQLTDTFAFCELPNPYKKVEVIVHTSEPSRLDLNIFYDY